MIQWSALSRGLSALPLALILSALPLVPGPASSHLETGRASSDHATGLASAWLEPARAAAAPSPPQAPLSERIWPDESIYFIMIDRFHNGDPSGDQDINPADPRAWHGGDIQGIIDKLDYIQSLGFTAIWVTPHVKNAGRDYHGYGAVDFYETDHHFGSNAKVKELVAKAHARSMKVIFDIVVNHTGPSHPLVAQHPDWFHPKQAITDWNDPRQVQEGWIFNLPDFDQSRPEVREYILDYSRFWIDSTGVDGFRLDTVKHVPHSFFTWYSAELQRIKPGFWLLGEDWESAPYRLAAYQEAGVTALLDFPMNVAARAVFARGESMRRLADAAYLVESSMVDPWQMGGFLDNHDMARFVTEAKDQPIQRLKLGLTFLFTLRSIPILYYGTEIGMTGRSDPYNRDDFPWGSESNPDVQELVRRLNQLRQAHPALRRGRVEELLVTDQQYAYARMASTDQVVVILNNEPASVAKVAVDVAALGLAEGSRLVDGLSGREVRVSGGQIVAELAPLTGLILRPIPAPHGLWGLGASVAGLAALVIAIPWWRRRLV